MIYPALDKQLETQRSESEKLFMVSWLATDSASMLHDHHNRDGELLLGVFVEADSTWQEVLSGLADEYHTIGWELGQDRLGFDYELGKAAIDEYRESMADSLTALYDSDLFYGQDHESYTDDQDHESYYDEPIQAWFLLHWEVTSSD